MTNRPLKPKAQGRGPSQLFYATFQTPRWRPGAAPGIGQKYPGLSPNMRQTPALLRGITETVRREARIAGETYETMAPRVAFAHRAFNMSRSLVELITYSGKSNNPYLDEEGSFVAQRQHKNAFVATASVQIDLTDPMAARLFSWLTRGTRSHDIPASNRSKVWMGNVPMLAIGYNGGRHYPSTSYGPIQYRNTIRVTGWAPSRWIEHAGALAEARLNMHLGPDFQRTAYDYMLNGMEFGIAQSRIFDDI